MVEVVIYQRGERWVAEAPDLRIAFIAPSRRAAAAAIRAMLRHYLEGARQVEVKEIERP